MVSVEAARRESGEQLPVMRENQADRSGLTWVLIVVALAVVLVVPALAWKLEIFGAGDGDEGEVPDPDGIVEAEPDAPDARPGDRPGDRRPRPDREEAGGKVAEPPADEVEGGDDPDEAGIETPAGREPELDAALEVLAGKVKIKGCFRKHRGRLGDVPAVSVSFVVAPGGALSEAQILRPTDLDESLARCLVGALDGMKLPKAAADEPVTRRYTFRRSGSGSEG